ncbi:MAG: hypothetical protein IJE57_04355 [Anaerotignum sp.]|nr:hypothetical protein [Anaerotignum sp.]
MSTYTENYNLIKPEAEDLYDINDFNENMDAIDTMMARQEDAMNEVSEKIGTPADSGSQTIFGKLNNSGGGCIKSIQRVEIILKTNGGSSTTSINTVDPNKCLVFLDRLDDETGFDTEISYTLNSNSLVVSTKSGYSVNIKLLFQIAEFY